MKKAIVFAAVAFAILGPALSAQAVITVQLDRTVAGLNGGGFFIPGTTTLDVTVTLTATGDLVAEPITALGVNETLPAGWTFNSVLPGGNQPQLFPTAGDTGTLAFAYFMIPAFPVTFSYRVNVNADPAAPVTISGEALFRTGGPELHSNTAVTTIQKEPTLITAARVLSGPGIAGTAGQFYVPGSQITVDITLTKTGNDAITALGFQDTVPAGWTVASVGGPNPPQLAPAVGATGVLSFGYFTIPAFPVEFTYVLNVPGTAVGSNCLDGFALYRLGGPEVDSPHVNNCLLQQPCITLTRDVPSTCYTAGANLVVNVTLTSACTDAITALGVRETIPAGWSFVSAGGTNPPQLTSPVGTTGTLDFGYFTIPAFPVSFSYTLAVPGTETIDPAVISGFALFRTGGPEIDTEVVSTNVCGADIVPPVITLNGLAAITIECSTTPFADPGATATDNVDGDITGDIVVTGTVDNTTPGIYTLNYDVTDAAGNPATTVQRTVTVLDTTAPVITLNGAAASTIECGATFTDPGATAADACEGSLTGAITTTGNVVAGTPGVYNITYDVSDTSGNAATTVTRTVTVQDTTAPVITLNGTATVTVQCGATYTDAGATATDTCQGSVTVNTTNPVNTSTPGSYQVTYNATDISGNPAAQVTRTVVVSDTTAPVITLNGANPMTVTCGAGAFTDPGATATDTCAGSLTGSITTSGTVNAAAPGAYTITYSVADGNGNTGTATRTVNVVDNTNPVITLNGANPLTVTCGSGAYTDAGATVTDTCDTAPTLTTTGVVTTTTPGAYTVTLTARDASGNTATATRTVNVVDNTPPTLTVLGNATVTVACGTPFVDPGASAADTCSGNITSRIVTVNPVDANTPGTYTITYNVSDVAGNAAPAQTRTVVVTDTTAPVISLNGNAAVTVECGAGFTDPGATASDTCDGTLTVTPTGTVDANTPGAYTITYNVSDAAGNAATAVTRTVTVSDTTNPTLSVLGSNTVTVECGSGPFTDAGATATDTCSGDLTASIVTTGGTVDTATPGTSTITYSIADGNGNNATATRTVNVVDTTAPVITLTGGTVQLACNEAFVDPGATATDSCEGTVQVLSNASTVIDNTTAGTYTVIYTATDTAGNTGTAGRAVVVSCEGEGEGEGEGQTVFCDLSAIVITSPTNDILVPTGVANTTVFFNANVSINNDGTCIAPSIEVVYAVNGVQVGTSTDNINNFPVSTQLAQGSYTLTATATSVPTGQQVVTQTTFNVRTCADANDNGYADDPFQCLQNDGDRFNAVVNSTNCQRAVAMVAIDGGTPGGPVSVQLTNPADPTQTLFVDLPREAVPTGERGILIVSISCDPESLLDPTQAGQLGTLPTGAIAGGAYFNISLITSADNGATFTEVTDLPAGVTAGVSLSGLAFTPDLVGGFSSQETLVVSDPATGITIQVQPGQFSDTTSTQNNELGGVLSASLTRLGGIFGPFEKTPLGPTLAVSPTPAFDFIAGIVLDGSSVDNTFTLRNIGSGAVTGTATITGGAGAFTLVGDAAYSLTGSQTDTIRVRFTPTLPIDYVATLNLPGGVNGVVTVTLRGTGTTTVKLNTNIFGCGPAAAGAGTYAGDLLAMAAAVALLALLARKARTARS